MSLTKPRQPIFLYRYPLSGHCHQVHTFLSMLELPHELIDVDLKKQEQKEPSYLSKNSLGQVPMIEDGELVLLPGFVPMPHARQVRLTSLQGKS
jgi:glutathione S-transferase